MDKYALLQAKLERLQAVQHEFHEQYNRLLSQNAQLDKLAQLHASVFAGFGDTRDSAPRDKDMP